MKQRISFILILSLSLLALTAGKCGGGNDSDEAGGGNEDSETDTTLVVECDGDTDTQPGCGGGGGITDSETADTETTADTEISNGLPVVTVSSVSNHMFAFDMVTSGTSDDSSYRIEEDYIFDQEVGLTFTVAFSSRTVSSYQDADEGLKGTTIVYNGQATGTVSLGDSAGYDWTWDESGTETWNNTDPPCGVVAYNTPAARKIMEFELSNSEVNLNVAYLHFIPDADSVNTRHPAEGLFFLAMGVGPVIMTTNTTSTDKDFNEGTCAYTYTSEPETVGPYPLSSVSNIFPMPTWQEFDMTCYGLQESVLDVIDVDDMAPTFRKVGEDGVTFDSLHLNEHIGLMQDDVAECWDYESGDATHGEIGTLVGDFTWDYTAEVIQGKFDLTTLE